MLQIPADTLVSVSCLVSTERTFFDRTPVHRDDEADGDNLWRFIGMWLWQNIATYELVYREKGMQKSRIFMIVALVFWLCWTSLYRHNGTDVGRGLSSNVVYPVVSLNEGFEQDYYLHPLLWNGRLHFGLSFTAEESISFFDLDPMIEFEYTVGRDEPIVMKTSVTSHLRRMRRIGRGAWADGTEWFCNFKWLDPKVNLRAVPFSQKKPENSKTLRCLVIIKNPKSLIKFRFKALPQKSETDVSVQFSVSTGWK